jgi:TrmH family RNA methyltransferase
VLLLPGCCDPFNEKALRASRGAALRLPLAEGGWQELCDLASDGGLKLVAAEPEGDGAGREQLPQQRQGGLRGRGEACGSGRGERAGGAAAGGGGGGGVCLVLGTEGQGLSETALRACEPVAVPMVGDMESLNVSVAGGARAAWFWGGRLYLRVSEAPSRRA